MVSDERNRRPSFSVALAAGAARLRQAGVPDAVRDARRLLAEAAGLSAAGLAAELSSQASATVPEAALSAFNGFIAERARRRPLSHVVGRRAFYGRDFLIDGRALDPRPESETLIDVVLAARPAAKRSFVLDLGVGSGCLLLTALLERPEWRGLGVDASPLALRLAAENRTALAACADATLPVRAGLRRGDWTRGLARRFDLVLCNPPYISEAEWRTLTPEVRNYEPKSALTPGRDALADYRRVALDLTSVLAPGGQAFFEVGRGQAAPVAELLDAAGFQTARHRDLGGVERVVAAWRAPQR